MQKVLINLINFYQKVTRNQIRNCKFFPTCSEYTKEALSKDGAIKGSYLGLRRVIRCHPWAKPKVDLVK